MNALLPAGAAAVAGILVGTGIVATRFVIDQTDPTSLALLRYAIGCLCLLPPAAMAGWTRIAPRDHLPIALLGILQFGILIVLLNFGLTKVSSSMGAIIFATFPIMTLAISVALRQEGLTLNKLLGVGLTFGGIVLVLAEKLAVPSSMEGRWLAVLALFGSALCGAVCSVLYRPYLRRYPPLQVSAYAMLASVAFLCVAAAAEGFFSSLPHLTFGGWLAVLFIGVSSGLGYYLWLWALRHSSPTKVTVFLGLNPIAAAALGALLLSESLSSWFLAGLVCVVSGLWFAYRPTPGETCAESTQESGPP